VANAQQHEANVLICCIEFHGNRTVNVQRTDRRSFTSRSKECMSVRRFSRNWKC